MNITNQATVTPLTSVVDQLRTDIDRIDDEILHLLEQRYGVVQRIARAKKLKETQALALRPGRERTIVDRLTARAVRVPPGDIRQIWRAILSLSAQAQRSYRVLLWGPEEARLALWTLASARYGEGVTVAWAESEAEALAEARRGDAILMVAAPSAEWLATSGLDLIGRHATGWPDQPWVLEVGRIGPSEAQGRDWWKGEQAQPAATGRTVAYLGGAGSFSEEACDAALPGHARLPLPDFAAVIEAVREGSADLAIVPVENTHAGPITAVQRLLVHPELRIAGETQLAVRLQLLGVPGSTLDGIVKVSSHAAALVQCQDWLNDRPWARMPMASTAEAAQAVAAAGDPQWAAIGSEAAGQHNGLVVLARELQGPAENLTRFVIVERRDQFA